MAVSNPEQLSQSVILSEQDLPQPLRYRVACGEVLIYTHRSPNKMSGNQDAAAILPIDSESAVLVVADGVGGGVSGEQAARLAVTGIEQALEEGRALEHQTRTSLITGIERANDAVQQLGIGTATTLAAVEVTPQAIRPYHVGDSLILVTGQRGKVKLETVSHSPVGYAVAAGVLDVHEAMHHEDRHLVSNVIGSSEMHIEVGPHVPLAMYDTVLIASDGLSDNLHHEEIVERIRKGPLTRAIRRLIEDCQRRMGQPDGEAPSKPDDLTIILFRRRRAEQPAHDA